MSNLICNYNIPFLSALAFVLIVGALEGVTTALGFALSGILDSIGDFGMEVDADIDGDVDDIGIMSHFLSFVNVGKVPLLILLILFCLSFGSVGMISQSIFLDVFGGINKTSTIISLIISFGLTIPFTRWLSGITSKLIPNDETYITTDNDLIGLVAEITVGKSTSEKAAEAKVIDKYNRTHYVMVKPLHDNEEFTSGTRVLLIEKCGDNFKVVKNEFKNL